MPFMRDRTPGGKDPAALRAWLERSFDALDDWAHLMETRVNELTRLRAISGFEIRYQWDDDTDLGTPPPEGFIKANAAAPDNATQYAVNRIDQFGRLALTGGLEFIVPGFLEVADFTRDTFYFYEQVGVTQRDDDLIFDVIFIDQGAGAPPQQDDNLQFQLWPNVIERSI